MKRSSTLQSKTISGSNGSCFKLGQADEVDSESDDSDVLISAESASNSHGNAKPISSVSQGLSDSLRDRTVSQTDEVISPSPLKHS